MPATLPPTITPGPQRGDGSTECSSMPACLAEATMRKTFRPHCVRQRERCGSVFRVYVGGGAVVSAYMALAVPLSLPADVRVLPCLLMAIGATAIVEVIFNDVWPAHLQWPAAFRQRHFILAVIAFCYGAQVYVASPGQGRGALMLYYLGNACLIMLASMFDACQRAKEARCDIVCN